MDNRWVENNISTHYIMEMIMLFTCILCKFDVVLDDTTINTPGKTICIRCWYKEMGEGKVMQKHEREEIRGVLKALPE